MFEVAFVGMGANLGAREETLKQAVKMLDAESGIAVVAASSVYETAPVGVLDQPYFLNAVLKVETELSAQLLLNRLLAIEQKLGRVRKTKWGPRTLDLDILLYGEAVIDQPGLRVPHPHLHMREFVLAPLCDLAPDLHHPELGESFLSVATSLDMASSVKKIDGLNLMAGK
ncbi:MAG: 2-amino-4-hydroxy-6-hydroxymethyldihydropteridine diphosphokinase [Candidatus Latescibacteria bacterium]|nr:2-amino-4-hydroxy-6-hydroxymethyldihydropteridine diphosphokinase [Candidatus Latescibacterota bacterium]